MEVLVVLLLLLKTELVSISSTLSLSFELLISWKAFTSLNSLITVVTLTSGMLCWSEAFHTTLIHRANDTPLTDGEMSPGGGNVTDLAHGRANVVRCAVPPAMSSLCWLTPVGL